MKTGEKQKLMAGIYIGIGFVTLVLGLIGAFMLPLVSSYVSSLNQLNTWVVVFLLIGILCIIVGILKLFIRKWPWWL